MTEKKIIIESRKNITKACTFCKTRKRKCDGQLPCSFCKLKNKQGNCNYDFVDKRSIRYVKKYKHLIINELDIELNENENENKIEFINENYKFIGESSPLNLLVQTKKIFQNLNLSNLAKNSIDLNLKNSEFILSSDFIITDSPSINLNNSIPLIKLPKTETAIDLIEFFIKSVNQILYIYDDNFLRNDLIDLIYNDTKPPNNHLLCQFYLIIAISFLYLKNSNSIDLLNYDLNYEIFYLNSLKLLNLISNDFNLYLIQIYMLLFVYNLFTNKKNNSWLNLSIAIKIAQSLGLNRKNSNLINKNICLQRRKLWRSLYIFDRIISINLGRPLTINNNIWNDINNLPIENDNNLRSVCQNELMKLNKLNGEIYEKIYFNNNIKIKTILKLILNLNNWLNNLPIQLKIENLLKLNNSTFFNNDQYNYNSLLYLHLIQLDGIILLTKPFFKFYLINYLKSNDLDFSNLIKFFKKICINSSILSIKVCLYFIKNKKFPIFSYTLINNILNSCLIISLNLLLNIIIFKKTNQSNFLILENDFKILNIGLFILREYNFLISNNYYNILKNLNNTLLFLLKILLNKEFKFEFNNLNELNYTFLNNDNSNSLEFEINKIKIEIENLNNTNDDDLEKMKTVQDLDMINESLIDCDDDTFIA